MFVVNCIFVKKKNFLRVKIGCIDNVVKYKNLKVNLMLVFKI